jgi:hypothetical protein
MATTPFTSFLFEVLPYVHDCPQIAATNAIRNAAIEFCERSTYWRKNLDPFPSQETVAEYTLVPPTDTRIVDTISVWFNSIFLVPKSVEELNRLYRGTDWRTATGQPLFFVSDHTDVIRLVPAPAVGVSGNINAMVALAPTRTAAGIDSNIFEKQLLVISRGARAQLLSMSGQPAYDPVQAQANRTAFMSGCNDARIRANKGATRTSGSVEIPRYV